MAALDQMQARVPTARTVPIADGEHTPRLRYHQMCHLHHGVHHHLSRQYTRHRIHRQFSVSLCMAMETAPSLIVGQECLATVMARVQQVFASASRGIPALLVMSSWNVVTGILHRAIGPPKGVWHHHLHLVSPMGFFTATAHT
jgi:hypothetical protein